jgi:hypothetical protein
MTSSPSEMTCTACGAERLPYELWRYILRLATNARPTISSPWGPLPPDSHVFHSWLPWLVYEDDYNSTHQTKSAIALVSRSWNNVTIDFLLEDITIRTSQQLCWFVEQLERNQSLNVDQTRLHPLHVKRVLRLPAQNFLEEYESWIQIMCNLCVNMKALSLPFFRLDMQRSTGLDFEAALSSRCRSLCFFELAHCDMPSKFIQNVVNLMNLEVLALSFIWTGDNDLPMKFLDVSLPRLHTLHISKLNGEEEARARWITSWNLPSLTNFRGETNVCRHLHEMGFFDVHGPKLMMVMLGMWRNPGVPEIVRCCSSLRRLRLKLPLAVGITPFHSKHLAANEITFLLHSDPHAPKPSIYSNDWLMTMFSWQQRVLETLNYPRIETVQFTSCRSRDLFWQNFKKRHTVIRWQKWLNWWAEEGIRLEDMTGDLVTIPAKVWDNLSN